MDKMGWLADRRTRRLAWLGGVFLTVTAVVAVFAVVLRPTSDSRRSASTRPPDRATARSSPVRPACHRRPRPGRSQGPIAGPVDAAAGDAPGH